MPRETRFQELKRYARFGARDAELLLAFRGPAAREFPAIALEFCERVREHAGAYDMLIDEQQIGMLQAALVLWMTGLCGGVYDENYYEQATQIGRAQLRIGLPQQHVLTAMARIRVALLRIADADLKEQAAATREALNRILDIELAVTLETYRATEERSRQAERLSTIGTLAAALAHEIRNPLNGAQLHVVLLERAIRTRASEQDMLLAAQVVAGEIKRLAEVLSEFLEFAQPKPLQPSFVRLVDLFQSVSTLTREPAEAARLVVRCQLPDGDVEFYADYDKVAQVLSNLVLNALEAGTASGAESVLLRGRRVARHVLIEVEDDGARLPRPAASIFDAFLSAKLGAAGFGLAAAHRTVSDHRGTIDVSSTSGKTTFRLTLPLEQPPKLTP